MNSRASKKDVRWTHWAPIVFVFLWSTGFIGARLGALYAEPFTFLAPCPRWPAWRSRQQA
jgi:hypothetical protein